jgi:hypothetical protein
VKVVSKGCEEGQKRWMFCSSTHFFKCLSVSFLCVSNTIYSRIQQVCSRKERVFDWCIKREKTSIRLHQTFVYICTTPTHDIIKRTRVKSKISLQKIWFVRIANLFCEFFFSFFFMRKQYRVRFHQSSMSKCFRGSFFLERYSGKIRVLGQS